MIDGNGAIRTTPGTHLLNEGDVIAFPKSGWVTQVTAVSDQGVRIELMNWIAGQWDGGERLLSWEQVFNWPREDFHVWGNGYLFDAAVREVRYATDRRLGDAEAPELPAWTVGGQE